MQVDLARLGRAFLSRASGHRNLGPEVRVKVEYRCRLNFPQAREQLGPAIFAVGMVLKTFSQEEASRYVLYLPDWLSVFWSAYLTCTLGSKQATAL